MYDGLYSYYEKKESFYEHKFGFRNNRSDINTCTNCNYWKYQDTLCDEGLHSCGVFLDLKKAFDTANHKILFSKLENFGIGGKAKIGLFLFFIKGRNPLQLMGKIMNSTKFLKESHVAHF